MRRQLQFVFDCFVLAYALAFAEAVWRSIVFRLQEWSSASASKSTGSSFIYHSCKYRFGRQL
jgi:hypothetical protein